MSNWKASYFKINDIALFIMKSALLIPKNSLRPFLLLDWNCYLYWS
jgi:hypothetical protein